MNTGFYGGLLCEEMRWRRDTTTKGVRRSGGFLRSWYHTVDRQKFGMVRIQLEKGKNAGVTTLSFRSA